MSQVEKLLQAVADGYPWMIQTPDEETEFPHGFIAVDSPKFEEDNGEGPFLVITYNE